MRGESSRSSPSTARGSSRRAGVNADQQAALEAGAYLREEADFNRSWTDGRRGAPWTAGPEYLARRIELAEQRERWARAIEAIAAARAEAEQPAADAEESDHA